MLKPMLLTDGGRSPFNDERWIWECKFDGFRAVVSKSGPAVEIFTRHLRNISRQFPEVVAGLASSLQGNGIFDGELIAPAADGRPDFYALNARHLVSDSRKIASGAEKSPAVFMGFDVIERAGKRVTTLPLTERKRILSGVVSPSSAVQLVESFPGTASVSLLQAVADRDMEGIVGKRVDSPYQLDTRSKDWLKVKVWKERTVTLLGIRREPDFGVLVGEPGNVLCVVELGWTPTDRRALTGLIPELESQTSNGVLWLKPYLRGRIRYRVSPTGRIREPVWDGFALTPEIKAS